MQNSIVKKELKDKGVSLKSEIVNSIIQDLREVKDEVELVLLVSEIQTALVVASHQDTVAIFTEVMDKVDNIYPTMVNKVAYEKACNEEITYIGQNGEIITTKRIDKEEDFNIRHRGEAIGTDKQGNEIVKSGGVSADYRRRVDERIKYSQIGNFWLIVREAEEQGQYFPDFDYNLRNIKTYIKGYMIPSNCKWVEIEAYISVLKTRLIMETPEWLLNDSKEIDLSKRNTIVKELDMIKKTIKELINLRKEEK